MIRLEGFLGTYQLAAEIWLIFRILNSCCTKKNRMNLFPVRYLQFVETGVFLYSVSFDENTDFIALVIRLNVYLLIFVASPHGVHGQWESSKDQTFVHVQM